jgi:hypothetical protein
MAEYATPQDLVRAAAAVRDAGYTKWDAHTPFPVHGLDDAMGIRPTRLPYLVLGRRHHRGLVGAPHAVVDERRGLPDHHQRKPFNSLPADIPVTFELTVLLASLTAFLGMLVANALPRFHHPLFANERFRRVTTDAFVLVVEVGDPRFEMDATRELLLSSRATLVTAIEA